MIYHYFLFSGFKQTIILEKFGLYAVAIFYILSGLTLSVVYSGRKIGFSYVASRVTRIFPLLWLASIGTMIVSQYWPGTRVVLLNFTGLFGFIDPTAYISTGAWSIGNELTFYALFPLLLIKKLYWPLFALLGAAFVYFAFFLIKSDVSLTDQWATYINPLNQAFLFAIGVGMARVKQKVNWMLFLFAGIVLFIFYPAVSKSDLVTGVSRLMMTVSVALICFAFYKAPTSQIKPLSMMGEASYSIYLLHPIVWAVVTQVISSYQVPVSIALTLIASYFTFHYFEKALHEWGKELFKSKSQ